MEFILIAILSFLYFHISIATISDSNYTKIESKQRVVRSNSGTSIFLVDESVSPVVKRDIPDHTTFAFLGFHPEDVEVIPDDQLVKIKTGTPLIPILDETRFITSRRGDCPCESYRSSQDKIPTKFICVESTNHVSDSVLNGLSRLDDIIIISTIDVNNSATLKHRNCMAIVKIRTHTSESFSDVVSLQCPGVCAPVPIMELPADVSILDLNSRITCSSTLSQGMDTITSNNFHKILRSADNSEKIQIETLAAVLRIVASRRFEECNEQEYWPQKQSESNLNLRTSNLGTNNAAQTSFNSQAKTNPRPRLKVGGLIMWIGSQSRLGLIMNQLRSLAKHYAGHTWPDAHEYKDLPIVGWLPTDDEYPCRPNTTLCEVLNTHKEYQRFMPPSELDIRGSGWACAQRRPLRALAHLLLLFDVGFVLLVDDDTFVNVKFLLPGGVLHDYVHGSFAKENVVVSELCNCATYGRKMVSERGFMLGGAGYLMSKESIKMLESNVMIGPMSASDSLRPKYQMKYLSVLRLASAMAARSCPNCVRFAKNQKEYQEVGSVAALGGNVRVVDICANVLSGEKTCHHSDHALSRCIIHGIYSTIRSANCNFGSRYSVFVKGYSELPGYVEMCQEPPVICDPNVHFTCHRMMPDPNNLFVPIEAGTRQKWFGKAHNESQIYLVDEFNLRHPVDESKIFNKNLIVNTPYEHMMAHKLAPHSNPRA